MRHPLFRASFDPGELVVDNFAGGGGASTGIAAALGREPDIAINHDPEAIAMHRANHPGTRHYCESVWKVDPREVCAGRPVGLAWFSPDCTHHSKAKGGKPRERSIRALAWVVIRWAKTVHPRVILLENVEEFEDWGPLDESGRPIPERLGETYRAWRAKLASYGYDIEERLLVAADYGTPTTRKRLFLCARCDGQPIIWPTATHGKGREPWRPASQIIDWQLPCPSIFERRKPLATATLRRIAAGVRRYVLEAGPPFIVPVARPRGGELALVAPTLVQTGYGERPGQAPRALDLGKPLGTVVACGAKHAVVAAFLSKHYGGVVGHGLERPIGTVTTVDHHAVTTAFLTKFYGTSIGADLRAPLPTVTASGWHLGEVRAFLVKYHGGERADVRGQLLLEPLRTVDTANRFGLVTVHGEPYEIADIGMRMLSPRELFRAQGFSDDYQIAPEHNGKPLTKTAQIALAGNSVCPQVAAALVTANVYERSVAA